MFGRVEALPSWRFEVWWCWRWYFHVFTFWRPSVLTSLCIEEMLRLRRFDNCVLVHSSVWTALRCPLLTFWRFDWLAFDGLTIWRLNLLTRCHLNLLSASWHVDVYVVDMVMFRHFSVVTFRRQWSCDVVTCWRFDVLAGLWQHSLTVWHFDVLTFSCCNLSTL